NGKIDKKNLPAPEGREGLGSYQAPEGLIEERLAKIWSELLGIDKISRTDDFFRLGGHSLLATQMVSRLRETLRLEVPLKIIFEYSVLSELARYLGQSHLEEGILPTITRVSRDEPQVLSFAQQRLWFIEQLLPNTGLYHNHQRFKLLGELNVSALRQALNAMVARHEMLRTVIINLEGIAFQRVLPEDTGFSLREGQEDVEAFINEPFQLDTEPLCRGLLLKHSTQEHILVFVFHHIVVDDWSMGIFCKELNAFYEIYSENKALSLAPLPVQYMDYSVWQRSWLQGEILEKQLSYWKAQLREVSRLELPADYSRPKELSYQGGFVRRKLPKKLLNQLQAFSQSQGVTLFMSLIASIQGFLSRYCNQMDIAVGTPIANRRVSEIEGIIGFFINTLVLRSQFEDNPSFETLIKRVESTTLAAYEHQDVPFEQLVDHLEIPREINRNPLFQVMFNLQHEGEKFQLGKLEVIPSETEEYLSRFDLLINAFAGPEGLYMGFEYAKDLFSQESMERLADCYETFLRALLEEPAERLSELALVGEKERNQLRLWNETQHDYPKDKTVYQLFEEQAEKTPNNSAIIYEGEELTYQELNERANQLAHYLRSHGVGPDTLVAIAVERSLEMIIGLLGILKAGGAYVPLDPSYPEDRLQFMLENTQSPVLLTQNHLKERFGNYSGKIHALQLDSEKGELLIDKSSLHLSESQELKWISLASQSSQNLKTLNSPYHLAYVIYTSGSTGRPKGVGISHGSAGSYLSWAKATYGVEDNKPVLFHGSVCFDMSITSLFVPLLTGKVIKVIKDDFAKMLEDDDLKETFSFIKLTPSHLKLIEESPHYELKDLSDYFIVGGEAFTGEHLTNRDLTLINEYGPTEATVACSIYEVDQAKEYQIIPI
ncbi:MAG: AMP-binding protein, partial [Legionella sp.]|nr:AMP-binding protein [Legionella sp.]